MKSWLSTTCSAAIVALMLSGCGNFLGSLGEKMSSKPEKKEQTQPVDRQLPR